jgi:hypothetical protein
MSQVVVIEDMPLVGDSDGTEKVVIGMGEERGAWRTPDGVDSM